LKYHYVEGLAISRWPQIARTFIIITAMLVALSATALTQLASAVDSTTVVTGDAAPWVFNGDPDNATPIEFNEDQSSIGAGALYVLPIGAAPAHKFIGRHIMPTDVSEVKSISYDFMIAGSGDAGDSNKFYLNVYANIDLSDNFYDCRFDYEPTVGSTTDFTTVSFAATDTPTTVTKRGDRIAECPATLAEMPAGSYMNFFSINMGDTTATDEGLAGYFDNVVFKTNADTKTYDFEKVYPVSGEITAPTPAEVVAGTTDLKATYDDGDEVNDDNVQWAVRQDTCDAGVGTVVGNVDGFSDVATWDGMDFSFPLDTTALADGDYCFVFNPTDDPGQTNVRETREFVVENPHVLGACDGDYDNVIQLTANGKSIKGTSGDDLIEVTGNRNAIRGFRGNDCIIVHGNSNSIRGNRGNDTIVADGVRNSVRGNRGDDHLTAGINSFVHGGRGTDTCVVDPLFSIVRSCEL